jgi:hypothetical protein
VPLHGENLGQSSRSFIHPLSDTSASSTTFAAESALTAVTNQEKSMNEKLNVRLGNPVVISFGGAAMLLTGLVIDGYWQPSRVHAIVIAVVADVFTVLRELLCCFVWCALSAWWVGRRTGSFDRKG